MNCLFCRIANNEIPAVKVYEDALVMAFLDISEASRGHTLVIPKQHFDSFLTCDTTLLKHLTEVAQKVAQAQIKTLKVDGINIISNAGESAGQSIFHFHLHLVPRKTNDGLYLNFPHRQSHSSTLQLQSIADQIKQGLI